EIDDARATGQRPDAPITIGTSRLATMNGDSTRIVMDGDAHVHRKPDAERAPLDVTSDQLILHTDTDVVETSLPARVVNGNHVLNGIGMRYDNQTRQLQVFSASDARLSGKDDQPGQPNTKTENSSP